MLNEIFGIAKILGGMGAIVTIVIVVARIWGGAARERYIKLLESELELGRVRRSQFDKDIVHYRQELHDVREKTAGEILAARDRLEREKDHSKNVELENATLKARPDLTVIETLLNNQKGVMQDIAISLTSHIESDAKIFTSLEQSLSSIAQSLNGHAKPKRTKKNAAAN